VQIGDFIPVPFYGSTFLARPYSLSFADDKNTILLGVERTGIGRVSNHEFYTLEGNNWIKKRHLDHIALEGLEVSIWRTWTGYAYSENADVVSAICDGCNDESRYQLLYYHPSESDITHWNIINIEGSRYIHEELNDDGTCYTLGPRSTETGGLLLIYKYNGETYDLLPFETPPIYSEGVINFHTAISDDCNTFAFEIYYPDTKEGYIQVYEFEGDTSRTIDHTLNSSPPLFPNPTSGTFRIEPGWELLNVFDVLGRQLHAPYDGYSYDLSDAPAAMYFLHVRKGDRELIMKLVKTE
jgi:hypothetical protein